MTIGIHEVHSRPKILLVDDEPDVLETTTALLEDEFEVVTAKNGVEAMALFANNDIDVVCTDFNMPGMNGMELLRETMQQRKYVSGVLVSGYREFLNTTAKTAKDRFLLLVKPYSPDALIELLHTATKYALLKRRMQTVVMSNVA